MTAVTMTSPIVSMKQQFRRALSHCRIAWHTWRLKRLSSR